jgi:CDP-4-dehydro-6-deoxyglucose reductase, E3
MSAEGGHERSTALIPRTNDVAVPEPISFEEPYRVISLTRQTQTILEVWLRPLAGALDYVPGQYLLLADTAYTLPPHSYSIANAPRTDRLLSLLVTRVPDGQGSTWIHECLRVGDDVSVSGAYGTFGDGPASNRPALFLAAGSGLAPIRALIEGALLAGTHQSLTLVFSAPTEAEVLDSDRFAAWQALHPRFHFIRTLTRASGVPPRGRIPAVLPDLCAELGRHEIFIAGAPGFVSSCAVAAEALGAVRARVHTEAFFVES